METSNKLNIQDLVDLLSEKTSIHKKEAESFLHELFAIISESITESEPVKLKNFGTFKLIPIQARESVDVNTGEKIDIPAHFRLGFSPASALKELVNKPFSHFETVLLNEGVSFEGVAENLPDEDEPGEEIVAATPPVENQEPVAAGSHTDPPNDKSPSRRKRRRGNNNSAKGIALFAIIAGAALIVIALAAITFVNKGGPARNGGLSTEGSPAYTKENADDDNRSAKTAAAPDTANIVLTAAETPQPAQVNPTDSATLTAGKTLRIIAMEKLGSREFWVYIYLKNKDRIKNPDVIAVGTKLILPHKSEYNMNPDDPQSVSHAKKLGDEEMKRLW